MLCAKKIKQQKTQARVNKKTFRITENSIRNYYFCESDYCKFFFLKLDNKSTKKYPATVRNMSHTCLETAVVGKVGITVMCIYPFQEVRMSGSCYLHILHILPFLLIIERNQTCMTNIFIEMIEVLQFFKIRILLNSFES